MPDSLENTLNGHAAVISGIKNLQADIDNLLEALSTAVRSGHKILLAGNGGSAADAQYIAAELIIRLSKDVQRPAIPAIALTTDSSILTAGGNDIGFDNVFARQVEGLGRKGDLLWLISTSGNSPNLIKAAQKGLEQGCTVAALLGRDGGPLRDLCRYSVVVPSDNTQYIQEAHMVIYHYLCEQLERTLYPGK